MNELDFKKMSHRFFSDNDDLANLWQKKYSNDKTPGEVFKNMAKLASEVEAPEKQAEWESNFNEILQDWKFIPGGRILYGLNESIKDPKVKVGLSNCFVIPASEDNLESILNSGSVMAKIFSRGGGVGINLDKIRPKGAIVNNSAGVSDGVVPFMNIFSNITENISIMGRRGALLLSLSVDHPDVIEFINSKTDLSKITSANISVRLTDDFMETVINEGMWKMLFTVKDTGEVIERTLPSNDIFNTFIKNSNMTGEPGAIFWDKVEKYSPNYYFPNHRVAGQNPCSEETLPEFGACLLGSVTLSKFVKHGLMKRAEVDWDSLKTHLQYGLRFLDNVIDLQIKYKLYPHNEQLEIAKSGRQAGLGILALHDFLILLGKRIDSEDGLEMVAKLSKFITNTVYEYDMDIAKEKGAFPDWDYDLWMKSDFVKELSPHLHEKAKECGVRNISMMSFAPTGSLSMLAGTSSGIEPIFQKSYDRVVKLGGDDKIIEVLHPLYKRYLEKNYDIDESVFVTAHEIPWEKRIRLQAILQKNLDTAISSTINVPADTKDETVRNIYIEAWKQGLKGITIYRDGSRTGILLKKKRRPDTLEAKVYQLKLAETTYYITISDIMEDGELNRKPFEIFVNSRDDNELLKVVTRLISAIMRRTDDITFVIKQLRKSANGSGLLEGIANIIEKHITKKQIKPVVLKPIEVKSLQTTKIKTTGLQECPECHQKTLAMEGGCADCKNPDCNYGRCSI